MATLVQEGNRRDAGAHTGSHAWGFIKDLEPSDT